MSVVIPDPAQTDWVPMGFGLGGPLPSQPSVRVYRSTQQSIPNAAFTALSFDTVRYDTSGQWSAANPTRLTCQIAGTYSVWANFVFLTAAGGQSRFGQIVKNGTQAISKTGLNAVTITAAAPSVAIPALVQLNVGDYLEVQVYQDSGAALNIWASDAANAQDNNEFGMTLVGGVPGPPGPTTSVSYGVNLPTNPVDGQEAVLVDSATNPSYTWRFRYNNQSTSPYKWEFVGGSPASSNVDAQENVTSTTYAALTTPGPSITLPRAGDYTIFIGTDIGPVSTDFGRMSYDIGATGAVDNDSVTVMGTSVGSANYTSRILARTGFAAGTTLTMKYRGSTTTGVVFRRRAMSVWPVRVA